MSFNTTNDFQDVASNDNGGARRLVQTGQEIDNPAVNHEPVRHNQAPRHTDVDGEVTSKSHGSFNTAEFVNNEAQGVLATAVTNWGAPAIELTKDTRVTIDGMQTTLENAHQLGYVTKNAMGQYVDTVQGAATNSEPQVDEQSQEESDFYDYDPIPENEENNINDLENAVGSAGLLSVAAEYAKTGVLDEASIAKHVVAGEHSTADVLQAAQQMATVLENQVMDYFTESGLPVDLHEDFGKWTQEHKETEYQAAFMKFLTTRQLSSWNGLLTDYAAYSRNMFAKHGWGR